MSIVVPSVRECLERLVTIRRRQYRRLDQLNVQGAEAAADLDEAEADLAEAELALAEYLETHCHTGAGLRAGQ
jgi:outer membrane protein TolC